MIKMTVLSLFIAFVLMTIGNVSYSFQIYKANQNVNRRLTSQKAKLFGAKQQSIAVSRRFKFDPFVDRLVKDWLPRLKQIVLSNKHGVVVGLGLIVAYVLFSASKRAFRNQNSVKLEDVGNSVEKTTTVESFSDISLTPKTEVEPVEKISAIEPVLAEQTVIDSASKTAPSSLAIEAKKQIEPSPIPSAGSIFSIKSWGKGRSNRWSPGSMIKPNP